VEEDSNYSDENSESEEEKVVKKKAAKSSGGVKKAAPKKQLNTSTSLTSESKEVRTYIFILDYLFTFY